MDKRLKKMLRLLSLLVFFMSELALGADSTNNATYAERISSWWSGVKTYVAQKISELRKTPTEMGGTPATGVLSAPSRASNVPVTPTQERQSSSFDAKGLTPPSQLKASSESRVEDSYTVLRGPGRHDLVIPPVQTQPALVLNRSVPVPRLPSIPNYATRAHKLVTALPPATAEMPLPEKRARFATSVERVRESYYALPADAKRMTTVLKDLSTEPLLKIDSLTAEMRTMLKTLFAWLLEPEAKGPAALPEAPNTFMDDLVGTLHGLALKSQVALFREKALSFVGWMLEEKSYRAMATVAFTRALGNSPANEFSRGYDNLTLESLSALGHGTGLAKIWLASPTAEKLLASKTLRDEPTAFLNLTLAERAYDKGNYAAARRLAQAVPAKSSWKEQGRYLAAIASFAAAAAPTTPKKESGARRTLASAKNDHQSVGGRRELDLATAGRELTELFRTVETPEIFDATAVSLGRIHFMLGNYKAAHQYLSQVSRDTNVYIEAAVDNGWALLRSGDRNNAVGNMFTLHTPYFEGAYMPESYFLQSLGYQEICQFGDAMTAVKQYKQHYTSTFTKLMAFNNKNATPPAAYYDDLVAYLSRKDGQLPGLVARELGRHPEFLRRQKELNLIVREQKMAPQKFPATGNLLSSWMQDSVDELRGRYKTEISKFLKGRAIAMEDELKFLTANLSLLEYEIFAGAGSNLSLQGAQNFAVDDKAVPKRDFEAGKEYWPYEDEIWEDELNNFRSKIVDGCAKIKKAT